MGLTKEKIFGICMRYASSKKEAEVIFKESFEQIIAHHPIDSRASDAETQIRHMVIDTILAHYKKTSIMPVRVKATRAGTSVPSQDAGTYSAMPSRHLLTILQRLPAPYRIVFNLYAIDRLDYPEIAEKLNIPKYQCLLYYENAVKAIKEMLKKTSSEAFHWKKLFFTVLLPLSVTTVIYLYLAEKSKTLRLNYKAYYHDAFWYEFATLFDTERRSGAPHRNGIRKMPETVIKKQPEVKATCISPAAEAGTLYSRHPVFSRIAAIPWKWPASGNLEEKPLDNDNITPVPWATGMLPKNKLIVVSIEAALKNGQKTICRNKMNSAIKCLSIAASYPCRKNIRLEAIFSYSVSHSSSNIYMGSLYSNVMAYKNTSVMERCLTLAVFSKVRLLSRNKFSLDYALGMNIKRGWHTYNEVKVYTNFTSMTESMQYNTTTTSLSGIRLTAVLNLGMDYRINSLFTLCGQAGIESFHPKMYQVNVQGGIRFNLSGKPPGIRNETKINGDEVPVTNHTLNNEGTFMDSYLR